MGILVSYRAPDDRRFAAIVAARLRGHDILVRLSSGKLKSDGAWLRNLEKRSQAFDYCVALVSSERHAQRLATKFESLELQDSNILFLVLAGKLYQNKIRRSSFTLGPFIYAQFGDPTFWRKFVHRLGVVTQPEEALGRECGDCLGRFNDSNVRSIADGTAADAEAREAGLSSVELLLGRRQVVGGPRPDFGALKRRLIVGRSGLATWAADRGAIERPLSPRLLIARPGQLPSAKRDAEIIELAKPRDGADREIARRRRGRSGRSALVREAEENEALDAGARVVSFATARASRVVADAACANVASGEFADVPPRRLGQAALFRLGIAPEIEAPLPHAPAALSPEDRAIAFALIQGLVEKNGRLDWARLKARGGSLSLLARDEKRPHWTMDLLNFIQRIKRGG